MIPTLIQRRGAQHLAEEEAAQAPADSPALNPPRSVLELIPESVARENTVLPLSLEGPVLYVATADASNILLRDKLSFIVNKDIRLVEFPRADILRAIRRCYGETKTESVDSMLRDTRYRGETFETDFEVPSMLEDEDYDDDLDIDDEYGGGPGPARRKARSEPAAARARGGFLGRKVADVGRALGKTMVDFKKGMKAAGDD